MHTIPNIIYLELKSSINKDLYEQNLIDFEEFKKFESTILKESEGINYEYKDCS